MSYRYYACVYCVDGCIGSVYGIPLNPTQAEMPLPRLSTITSSSPALMFVVVLLPFILWPSLWVNSQPLCATAVLMGKSVVVVLLPFLFVAILVVSFTTSLRHSCPYGQVCCCTSPGNHP